MNAAFLDFWILTSVCEAPHPISWLYATNRGEVFNLPELQCTRSELAESLERLLANNAIYAERIEWSSRKESEETERRTRLELSQVEIGACLTEEARTGRFSVYYGLTAIGGERWERAARPNWDKYVDRWFDPAIGEGAIAAHSRVQVEHWLEVVPFVEQGHEILSVSLRELRPWQATYWKSLASGHEGRYRTREIPSAAYKPSPKWVIDLQVQASRWYSWIDT